MSNFTPGPWEMRHDGSRKWCEYIITGKNNGTFTPTTATIPRYTGQDEANAHLISAAPRLYDALKAIAEMKINESTDCAQLSALCIAIAKTALAKVEKGE